MSLRDDMAILKVRLRCSQEEFVDLLKRYYTQQLAQIEDPDAVPDWVMLSFSGDLSQIFRDLRAHPGITQGQWIRILKTALEDAQDGLPSAEPIYPSQPAQHVKPVTCDATFEKFQNMDKELNAGTEVMEVAEESQVLDSQPMSL